MSDALDPIFHRARKIELRTKESAEISHTLHSFIANTPVRAEASTCLTTSMDQKTVFHAAKNVHLSGEESVVIEQNVRRHMLSHPVRARLDDLETWPSVHSGTDFFGMLLSFLYPLRPATFFSAITALIVASGTGMSVMARTALPGDFLYAVKVHVNENVSAALQSSPDARALFETELLESRLREAAQLATAGQLKGDLYSSVSRGINRQLTRTQDAAAALALSGQDDAALDVHSQVESDLTANANVLISFGETSPTAKADVQDLLKNVSSAESIVTHARVVREKSLPPIEQVDLKTRAETSIQNLLSKIDTVRLYIEQNADGADSQVVIQARGRLDYSKRMLTNARTRAQAGQYADAIQNVRDAQGALQEAKTMVAVSSAVRARLQ